MELFISEAEIEDASMIIDYLNQVGGESDNLTYGLNECYLNEFEEMEVIQDFNGVWMRNVFVIFNNIVHKCQRFLQF